MNFSKVSFSLFSIELIGVFLGVIFFVVAWGWYKQLQQSNFSIDYFTHHFWKWVLCGFFVGRCVSLVLNPDIFIKYGVVSFFAFWEHGIHVLGGLFGFLLMMWIDFKKTDFSFLRWIDLISLNLVFGLFIYDIASFLTGHVYGKETDLFWGVRYETFGVEIISPVHPVTLYMLIFHMFLYVYVKKHKTRLENQFGVLFLTTLWWLVCISFVFSFLRADEAQYLLGMIRISQVIELLVLVVLFILLHKLKMYYKSSK